MRFTIAIILSFIISNNCYSQESKLAQQYFIDGEYEKAAVLYEKLSERSPNDIYLYNKYIECLIAIEDYETAINSVSKKLKKFPERVYLYVVKGNIYEQQYEQELAEAEYKKAIETLPADRRSITRLASKFMQLTKYDLAIKTYERGSQLLKDDLIFSYYLGDLYRRKGETPNMIENYLNSLLLDHNKTNNLKTIFQRYLLPEDYRELKSQLYTRIQENENALFYNELLTWVFIQTKDYRGALRQVKALDRRFKENGGRIFRLGQIASIDGDYDTAIEAFDYIVESQGTNSSFYVDAKQEALKCRRNKLTEGYDYEMNELTELEGLYIGFLDEFGRSWETAGIILELAELQAYYLNNLDKGIKNLQGLMEVPGIIPEDLAQAKLGLADFYLIKGEVWEATLLYSQVDKTFKEDLLGHEARYRNAKLSYFNGDFQWAQAQFDILKASTSKLISNDAIDMSVFIMDNLGLDTTAVPLEMYAQAELLVFQNKFEEAFDKLDSLIQQFPDHSLDDDVLYLEAGIYTLMREYEKAIEKYELILEKHLEEIRADNALYNLAELYETRLNDKEKAMELYEKLFIEFTDSILAVEARKKFRKLRGDKV